MRKIIVSAIALTMSASALYGQSIWDRGHLDNVKTQLERPMYSQAYEALTERADRLLDVEPLSVMMKKKPSPSGDNHNYTSLARYYHPDPSKPDGLPTSTATE